MVSTITVSIKNEEKNLKMKYLTYEVYTTDENDPIIQDVVKQTLDNFDGDPSDVTVNIRLEI